MLEVSTLYERIYIEMHGSIKFCEVQKCNCNNNRWTKEVASSTKED